MVMAFCSFDSVAVPGLSAELFLLEIVQHVDVRADRLGHVSEETRIARRDSDESALSVRARDNRLVARTLAGDDEAFEDLARLYYDRVRGLVHHHLHREDDLDDALQDIFLKAYQALPQFRKRSNFYTWLFRIASNHCIDRLRKRRLDTVSLDSCETRDAIEASLPRSPESPEEKFTSSERVRLVRKALDRLDPLFQSILVLRELEGLSYEEIVETLGLNIGTVKSRLARARMELRKALEEMDVL
jgi:RNA polymerase sigma-70 factor (ECF subfamily)